MEQALSLAREAGLDLVEVSPTENPPVCRIMDYGKHQYEKKKRAKMAAAAHQVELKEIRLRPKTDPHDRQIKLRNALKFLEDGNKVQFTMLFRGRERFNKEFASAIFNEIIVELADTVKIERAPLFEGRRMIMIVAPGKPGTKPKPAASTTPKPAGPPKASGNSPQQQDPAGMKSAAAGGRVAPTEEPRPTAPRAPRSEDETETAASNSPSSSPASPS